MTAKADATGGGQEPTETTISKTISGTAKPNATGDGKEPTAKEKAEIKWITGLMYCYTIPMTSNRVQGRLCVRELPMGPNIKSRSTKISKKKRVIAKAGATDGGQEPTATAISRPKRVDSSHGQNRIYARDLPMESKIRSRNTAIAKRKWVTAKVSAAGGGKEPTETRISTTKWVE